MNIALASDPFAPLPADMGDGIGELGQPDEPRPILPVPADAPTPSFCHPRQGRAAASWAYRDSAGALLGYVVRFDCADGKQVLPLTWCAAPDGRTGWRWKAFPEPRPLYGLDQLACHPDAPVLVVEGEKTADAAGALFPDHVAVTWPGGSNAVRKADWQPLAGRSVTIWPDADAAGSKAAEAVAAALITAKAGSIALVALPPGLPQGWDLADSIPQGLDVQDLLCRAKPVRVPEALPPGYSMTSRGLLWRDPSDENKPEFLLSGTLEIEAETRDADGGSWGILLSWRDHDGRQHRFALPRAMLAGDGAEARRVLLDGGLYVSPGRKARELFTAFLVAARSPARVTATGRIGWHGRAFVLPDTSFGSGEGEDHLLQGSGALEHTFKVKGTLTDWQEQVACHAVGNSRLALALSASFAAALVGICEAESGGLHLRGASSTGKSTALLVAGSAWGGGEPSGYVRSWRATSNGLEGVALGHCDALLCLDELAQVPARDAGEVAYMLANGSGKSRSARDGSARRSARWRILFLSSGEIGLADKVAEDGRGRRLAAGQQVRIVDIPADARAGLGLFESLHGFPSPEAFARHLRTASTTLYGSAARAFLASIAGDLEGVRASVNDHIRRFTSHHVSDSADGQVHRVAQRFALIAAGGELATAAGVLPWPSGEATNAAARCFGDWLQARGGTEPAEIRDGIAQVRAFLLANGMARFVPAWEGEEQRIPVRDIAGFRKQTEHGWDYYVASDAWTEVCSGLDGRALAAVLAERGMLAGATQRHRSVLVTVPAHGKRRLYHLPASFLESGADE